MGIIDPNKLMRFNLMLYPPNGICMSVLVFGRGEWTLLVYYDIDIVSLSHVSTCDSMTQSQFTTSVKNNFSLGKFPPLDTSQNHTVIFN